MNIEKCQNNIIDSVFGQTIREKKISKTKNKLKSPKTTINESKYETEGKSLVDSLSEQGMLDDLFEDVYGDYDEDDNLNDEAFDKNDYAMARNNDAYDYMDNLLYCFTIMTEQLKLNDIEFNKIAEASDFGMRFCYFANLDFFTELYKYISIVDMKNITLEELYSGKFIELSMNEYPFNIYRLPEQATKCNIIQDATYGNYRYIYTINGIIDVYYPTNDTLKKLVGYGWAFTINDEGDFKISHNVPLPKDIGIDIKYTDSMEVSREKTKTYKEAVKELYEEYNSEK